MLRRLQPLATTVLVSSWCCGLVACGSGGDEDAVRTIPTPRSTNADAYVLSIKGDTYLIGPWQIKDPYRAANATIAGAEEAFGPATSCRGKDAEATATWREQGVSGWFYTLGFFATADGTPGRERGGCHYRDQIGVGYVRLTDERWHTAKGLHVGDSRDRMLELYPAAAEHQEPPGWRGWWLHEVDDEVASPIRNGPDLIATVEGDELTALTVHIGAGGD